MDIYVLDLMGSNRTFMELKCSKLILNILNFVKF